MPRWILSILMTFALAAIWVGTSARAACLQVADDPVLAINPDALKSFTDLGLDRDRIFQTLNEISQTETSGCWAAPSGNFDGQLISVGTAQWNYGQDSLQPLLVSYRNHFLTKAAFDVELHELMPQFGELIFSPGCLTTHQKQGGKTVGGMTVACRSAIAAHETANGRIDAALAGEFEALFNSKTMRQVQLDRFVQLLGRVRSDLGRLFPGQTPSPIQIQWAIDTKVQQDTFPTDKAIDRLRGNIRRSTPEQLKGKELAAVGWYQNTCMGFDSDGVRYDVDYNVKTWTKIIEAGQVSPEQVDLIALTVERSRTAVGEDGRWQALTFQRRMKIILGAGSVGGNTRTRPRTT